jgi:hypothetical protein
MVGEAGDFAFTQLPGLRRAASQTQTQQTHRHLLARLRSARSRALAANPRNAGLYTGSITIADNGAAVPAQVSRDYPCNSSSAGVWTTVGGARVNAGGLNRFCSAVIGTTSGTVGLNNGKNSNFWRVSVSMTGRYLAVRVGATSAAYRFLVNGQYVSKSGTVLGTTTGNTYQYLLLDFGARGNRIVTVEGWNACAFGGALTEATAILAPAPKSGRLRGVFLGDSYIVGSAAANYGDGLAPVLADYLGVDLMASGSGGTGWNQSLTTVYRFDQRIANGDLGLDGTPEVIFLMASVNDRQRDQTVVQANALAGLQSARAQYPGVPIIVFGCAALPAGTLAQVTATEQAVQAAVMAFADPLTAFVPVTTDALGAWDNGTGSELIFNAPLVGATSGTLATAWTNGTVSYTILFSDGSTRTASFTQNSTAVTWTGAVTADAKANVYQSVGNSIYQFNQDWTHRNDEGCLNAGSRAADAAYAALETILSA